MVGMEEEMTIYQLCLSFLYVSLVVLLSRCAVVVPKVSLLTSCFSEAVLVLVRLNNVDWHSEQSVKYQ